MSQLNFFLNSNETLNILNSLLETYEIEIFNGWSFENEYPQAIKNMTKMQESGMLTFWFKNKFQEPKVSILNSGINKGRFSFDYYKDPIIEFRDCKRTSSLISPGRIFYKAGWVEDEQLRNEHKKWAAKISRHIDKKLKKIDGFWRISDEVENWVMEGGSLELGLGGKIINKENLNIQIKR
ncbi:hypothetical protein [Mucilaginibacter sp. NFX135]|uniref:hypothetical protein n=1 Tax=Mucilaginibacter sp. NFX135 TaxID=3402687 RepID=UPI003AFA30BE